MRIESSVTSLSWIPSEAVTGMMKVGFEVVADYDAPPPDVIVDLEELAVKEAFRFANELRAWIEVEDGRVTGYEHSGRGYLSPTRWRLAGRELNFAPVAFPTLRPEPEVRTDGVRFVQTAGGRTGSPAPRPVSRPPFFRIEAPSAWTTLALTINVDGTSQHELVGASSFPRHWIYDHSGKLVGKSGLIDFKTWSGEAWGKRTPWGDEDSPALVTEVESALERELSRTIMQGSSKPEFWTVKEGDTLVEQGEAGDDLFVLLDGILSVEVDGEPVAEVAPGAILGERALLEGGRRTSTLRARTRCRVAIAGAEDVDRSALSELAGGHRREEQRPSE